jgi:hypothetical protein
MYDDDAYGLKSIVAGTVDPESSGEDTQISWENVDIAMLTGCEE